MTTKEKIEALDNLIGMVDDNHGTDYDEALKSAKHSLEAWDKVKTNGDVIKAMFPNAEISLNLYTPSVDIFFGGILMMRANMKWWNAPYKIESEEK